uniref:Uncharacterized protein n=1 Tax=Macrostomum lignano TaxID=282301 RepID=A0A1I8H2E3_9PLAT
MRARLQWRRRPLGEVELPDSVPTELEESEMAATAAASVSSCLSIHCQDAQAAGLGEFLRQRTSRLWDTDSHCINATVAAPSAAAPSNSASLQQLPPPSPTSQQQPPPKPRSRCIGKPLNTSTAAPSTAEVQHTGQQTESRYKFPDALFG